MVAWWWLLVVGVGCLVAGMGLGAFYMALCAMARP